MNREFKPNIGIALLFTSLTLFGANASAVTFNVSNADEFQAALTTAGSNGGDDEIVLTPGTYGGNFKYTAGESAALSIRAGGDGEERAVLDGELRAYVLKIVPGCYQVDLSIERLDIINGKSEEAGGGLAFVSNSSTLTGVLECDAQEGETQVEQGSKSSLTLRNVIFENNYAKDGAGIKANGLSLADISETTFLGNGYYVNPSITENNPGGSGSAHLGLQADQLIFRSNFIGAVGLPYGGNIPSAGSNLFSQAVSLTSSGGATTVEQCELKSIIEDNRFEGISTAIVASDGLGETYNQEVIPYRDPISLGGGACTDVLNNKFQNIKGATLSLSVGTLKGNVFENLSLIQGISISGLNLDIDSNSFRRVDLIGDSESWGMSLGYKAEGSVISVSLEDAFISSTSSAGRISRNVFSNMKGNLEIKGSGSLSGNVFFNVRDRCTVTMSGSDLEIRNNSVGRSSESGFCISVSELPNAEVEVVNNIVWPLPNTTGGTDIERIGYGLKSTLKNNIYQTASELWDVSEGNIQADPGFFDTEAGDLHVVEGSIAINAGVEDGFFSSSDLDIDGNARVLDGALDIGAFERSAAALHPADTNGDSSISSAEFEAYNSAWRNNELWSVAPETIPVDFVTRAGYLLQKGGSYKNIGVGKPATWVPVNE